MSDCERSFNYDFNIRPLTLSSPESVMATCQMYTVVLILTFQSVDKILWRDHLKETPLVILLHGTICFSIFDKMKIGVSLEF